MIYYTLFFVFFFFFNDTATTEIYTLSLHDALPIYVCCGNRGHGPVMESQFRVDELLCLGISEIAIRSEEHTSELQSLRHLVCRLLLEKKKKIKKKPKYVINK